MEGSLKTTLPIPLTINFKYMTINSKVRQPCEVYSRTCGYLRPKASMNDAKQAEFSMRVNFKTDEGQTK